MENLNINKIKVQKNANKGSSQQNRCAAGCDCCSPNQIRPVTWEAPAFCQNMIINGPVIIPTIEFALVMNLALPKYIHAEGQMEGKYLQ